MPTYVLPTQAAIREIEQARLPVLTRDRPIFEILPIDPVPEWYIRWEQEDDWTGLQQLRGLDGEPSRVLKPGAKAYVFEPAAYGEFIHLSERELTIPQRALGTWNGRVDLRSITDKYNRFLLMRELDRIEVIGWLLLTAGSFTITERNIVHTDAYSVQTYDATTWATVATATPLADLRAAQLLSLGRGVSFGANSTLWVNRVTMNNVLANTNAADLGGQLTVTINGIRPTIANMDTVNQFLAGQDLPAFRVYEGGYKDDAGNFQRFIPSGKALLEGQRIGGAQIGVYQMSINANNPDNAPGSYMEVWQSDKPPKNVEVHRGHNGGPRMEQPSAIVVLDVS